MVHRLLCLLVLGAALGGADASASFASAYGKGAVSLHMKLAELQHKHRANLKRKLEAMTTTAAMSHLRKRENSTVMDLVQSAMQQSRRAAANNLRAAADPAGYSGVDKAKEMINEMIQETQAKYDLEIQTCCDYDSTQSLLIEQTRQDISNFNAEAAEARKEVLDAQDHIEICQKKLPELNDALFIHNNECKKEIAALREQLAIIDEDLRVMNVILGMINCDKDKKSASSAALLTFNDCVDDCGESFVSFQHEDMQSALSRFQHNSTKELVLSNLYGAGQDEAEDEDEQPNAPTGQLAPNTTTTTTWGPPALQERQLKRSGPCKTPVPEDKRTGKCSLDKNPNCERMQEKFVVIQSGIEDKRDEVQQQLDDLIASCLVARTNLEAQISDFETQLQDQLTALAAATKKQNTAEEQSRLKSGELKMFVTDYDGMTDRCHTNYEVLEGDECGLKKIRGELYKMKGQDHPAFFQDCIVSDWLPSECSKSCGTGTLKLTRTIVTAPVGGASCPVMEEEKSCNEFKCPIDCVLDDWGGWSACTAKCGGGLMERARDATVEPEHGGQPCEEMKEAKSCNLQSCDADCELSDWAEWGDCSKACNTGQGSRVRTIVVPLKGDGTCAKIRDPTRLQGRVCNNFPCANALLAFKYFKFKPDMLRNNGAANSVQIADVSFLDVSQVISLQGWKAENPGGKSPGGQDPSKAVDENSGTKWLDFNKKELLIEAPSLTEVSHFRFWTANDATERDPVKWTLSGSKDKKKWEVLYKEDYIHDTPTSRYTGTKWFPLPTQPLRCASEVDVVLVLDGSGSLRRKGWDATVKAAEMIVNSFMDSGKVQMSILLFSQKADWVQHFSSDKKETLENIAKLKWPCRGTKTSLALNTAAAELSLGRGDASSVVIVITDGKPQSPRKTKKAAEKLRKQARLMFVPVTKYAPLAAIKEMASYPKEDNIVVVPNFADLESATTIDNMISNACPVLY